MTLGFFPRASLPISPLLFFGPYCLLIGYLIFRSGFLPRMLGVLMASAGLGWHPCHRAQFIALHWGPRCRRGSIGDAMSHCDGRERWTMERTGRCSRETAVYHFCGRDARV